VHDRFFFMAESLWASPDGQHWDQLKEPYRFSLLGDIAYGNGLYLGVGLQTVLSADGTDWRAAPIDCAVPGACIAVPPDGTLSDIAPNGLFSADDHFHIRLDDVSAPITRWFTSLDGEAWQPATDPAPDTYVSGHFARLFDPQPLLWSSGDGTAHSIDLIDRTSSLPSGVTPEEAALWSAQFGPQDTSVGFPLDETMPDELDFSWNDGLDCTQARCFVATLGTSSVFFLVSDSDSTPSQSQEPGGPPCEEPTQCVYSSQDAAVCHQSCFADAGACPSGQVCTGASACCGGVPANECSSPLVMVCCPASGC
jgi:hypothetical protein